MTEAERKQKWIDALRSGKYQQCQDRLRYVDGDGDFSYCCLGVYHDINGRLFEKEKYNCRGVLEDTEWAEETYARIRSEVPLSVTSKGIEMNDDGKSFLEIADMIEEEWVID